MDSKVLQKKQKKQKKKIIVPSAGESVTQATIGQWHKKTGDYVRQNEVLVLMETDKASMDLIAEHSGQLNILKQEGEDVQIGEVIGELDTFVKAPALEESGPEHSTQTDSANGTQTVIEPSQVKEPHSLTDRAKVLANHFVEESKDKKTKEGQAKSVDFLPSDQQLIEGLLKGRNLSAPSLQIEQPVVMERPLSPAVRKLVAQNSLSPSVLPATGPGGRITKGDVLAFLSQQKSADRGQAPLPPASLVSLSKGRDDSFSSSQGLGQKRERMSLLRRRIAERLVESQQSTATLTTFNEIDMSQVISLRKQYQEIFQKKHQVKLGFMGFFIKALVYALRAYPRVNAFIEGNEVVYNQACHIGVAVSTDRGLVVPVIRHAEQKSLAELEKEVLFYALKARDGKISPDDLTGGTFTISNGGVFGSLMSTPILNPPQSGILGMHRIEARPMAVEGKVEIRPMMYVALSYDHRMVDGRESVGFLLNIKECVEEPMRLMLSL